MNLEHMTKLRDWLLAGAPHVYFSISYGLGSFVEGEYSDIPADQFEKGHCGTVCCIAGAAAQFSGLKPEHRETDWSLVRALALDYLGLPSNGKHMGHDLFCHELAPTSCTPQRAAQAVQNVMEGKAPWIAVQNVIDFNNPKWEEYTR